MTPLIELFSSGGPVMFFIAGVSLVAWFLTLRTWMAAGLLLKRIQRIGSPLLESLGRSNGVSSVGYSPQLQESCRDYPSLCFGLESQTMRLRRTLWLIGTLAAVLPLLGLLGTVLGMLISFEVIQFHGTSQPRLLAGGIGQALVTTQTGLWMAVPVLFFHHIIRGRVQVISNEMEVISHVLHRGSANGKRGRPGDGPAEQTSNNRQANHSGGR